MERSQRMDLQHKQRSVKDLIRFIQNVSYRNGEKHLPTPNFSVLLGAGASVTSGIRSGQELISQWKSDIYKEQKGDSEVTSEKINDFFETSHIDWYDKSNPYSSLFEKQFDLQRQRRIFVEKEVANKNPSIGYAYLVKLIDEGFFNTIFTTNFDDLLNEAFYRYSQSRPIVCAHDSSITGVTITSERPKIIKLHGDYLYDNIKTTLRETESLESNMRMKFQEFAKDFGLIVIGYSGQDRSIMDILTYLLQHEEYFKNGVYWCIRQKDFENISAELKKLLWKERVYYILIDGFDELMAELNNDLNNGSLPIDDSFLSWKHQEDIIRELTENEFLKKSNSQILESACHRLKKNLNNSRYSDFIQYLKALRDNKDDKKNLNNNRPELKSSLRELTEEEKKQLEELQRDIFIMPQKERTWKKVQMTLENMDIVKMPDSKYKLELLELYADSHKNLTDEQLITCFNELIRLAPKQQKYYIIASNRIKDYQASISYINRAVQKFPNDLYVHNKLTELLLEHLEDIGGDLQDEIKEIEEHIHKSLELNKGVENDAYEYKIRMYKLMYRNNLEELKQHQDELCEELKRIAPWHPNVLYVFDLCDKLSEKMIKESIDFYSKSDDNIAIEKCYIHLLNFYSKDTSFNFDKILDIFKEYESEYEPSADYQVKKGIILEQYEYLKDALDIFDSVEETEQIIIQKMKILSYLELTDQFENLYNKVHKSSTIIKFYYELSNNYKELIDYIEQNEPITADSPVDDVIDYAYGLLKLGDYAGVERVLKPYYDSPAYSNGSIIINYLFARQKQGKNVDPQIKNKITESKYIQYGELEKLGAYGVLGDRQEMYRCLSKILKNEPIMKYNIDKWPIMEKYKNEEKYINLMKRSPQSIIKSL